MSLTNHAVLPSRCSLTYELLEPHGIANRVPVAIVVEVDENIASHTLPLLNPIRPPAQIAVRVRPAVQVVPVWTVEPDVDEVPCRPEDAGKMRTAHHAVSRAVLLE